MDRSGAASTVVASACATVKNSMLGESTENARDAEGEGEGGGNKENEKGEDEDEDPQEDDSFVKVCV